MNQLELWCESLATGGRAVARHQGRVIFVEGACPKERVLAEVTADKGRFLEAKVLEILEPSVDRVAPRCRHFGECGGCSWQFLSYDAQLRAKKTMLEDSLRRLGKMESWPEIEMVSGNPWGFRNRAQFQPPSRQGGAWGFFASGTRQTVELQECPILAPELQGAWKSLGNIPSDPWADRRQRTVFAWGAQGSRRLKGPGDPRSESVIALVNGRPFHFAVDGFFQSNLGLVPRMVDLVIDGADGQEAWDLYAGVGLFAGHLQDRFETVHAIESDPLAAIWAGSNLKKAFFHQMPVEEWLGRRIQSGKISPDLVVVDPPRQGLTSLALERLLESGPRRIRYVSCSHDTLARDLRQFLANKYLLDKLFLIDFYPQTPHLEVVVYLSKVP